MTGSDPNSKSGRDQPAPPRWSSRLLGMLLPSRYRDQQLGDLSEGFHARGTRSGYGEARRWYRRQVLTSLGPALRLRIRHLRPPALSRSTPLDELRQDLSFGVRSIARNPGFAAVSTTTLALAIGVTTAVFSLTSLLLFRDLVEDPDNMVLLRSSNATLGGVPISISYADFLDVREWSESFQAIAAQASAQWIMTNDQGEPRRLGGGLVTANWLDMWGHEPALGRDFLPGEDEPGSEPVVMLSHSFWQSQFGGRSDVLGTTLRLDGEEHTVVGVRPTELELGGWPGELWATARLDRDSEPRDQRRFQTLARLKPGTTQEQAAEEIAAISTRLAEEHPAVHRGWTVHSISMMEGFNSGPNMFVILVLTLTVGAVLLIACANVGNMLLARGAARGREMAVRVALGAGRIRIVRQLLTENLLIGWTASVLGLALGTALLEALALILGQDQLTARLLVYAAGLDAEVMQFTVALSLATPVLFGLVPALVVSSGAVTQGLKDGGSGSGGRRGNRTRGFLVGSQIALAIMLTVVTSLLVRSAVDLRPDNSGFEPAGLLTMDITLPEYRYAREEEVRSFYEQLLSEIEALPGIQGAALGVPPTLSLPRRSLVIDEQIVPDGRQRPVGFTITTSPSYFRVVGIPILLGRGFTSRDASDAAKVAVVSMEAASRFWPAGDALGHRFRLADEDEAAWIQIVGIAGDVSRTEPDPLIYLPFEQETRNQMWVIARAAGDPSTVGPLMRAAVWAVDDEQPVNNVRTMVELLSEGPSLLNVIVPLFATFAVFALGMAALGVYGVMSYFVSLREREIGIRMAVGAESADVRTMILWAGAKILAVGAGVGILGALIIGRLLSSTVAGIAAPDTVTLIGVPAILGLVALLAIYVPARRATRMDPMMALRAE